MEKDTRTYGQLARQEIDLAKRLMAEGKTPAEVVAILRERAAAYRARFGAPPA